MSTAATRLRRDVAGLTVLAAGDLAALWRQVATAQAAETALRDVLPALIEAYGAGAATVAADWYDDLRDEHGVRRRFAAIPADISDVGAQPLVGWALAEARDLPGFQALILGGVQRRIANHARLTVTASSLADPGAQGWVRVGAGECEWCRQYLDGEIHYAEGYDFDAHDNCNCQAEPAF